MGTRTRWSVGFPTSLERMFLTLAFSSVFVIYATPFTGSASITGVLVGVSGNI